MPFYIQLRCILTVALFGALFFHTFSAWAQIPPEVTPIGYDGRALDPSKPVVVSILTPRAEEITTETTVDVFFEVQNYALAQGGNCLHVIHNNDAPIVWSDLRRPITLRNLPEGGHCLRVIAARPDGSALSNPEAYAMVYFFVRKKDFQNFIDPVQPYLTVNLPLNGPVEPDANDRIWLDFRVENSKLSPASGYLVRYEINGVQALLNNATPIYWTKMKPGLYKIKVEFVTSNQQSVPGIANLVERTFTVKPAPPRALPLEPAPGGSVTMPGSLNNPPSTTKPGAPPRAIPVNPLPPINPRENLD